MDRLGAIFSSEGAHPAVIATTVVATLSALVLIRATLYLPSRKVIESPLRTAMPSLPKHVRDSLVYVEDSFPGGRDVATPYGDMRVYEWGPEDGPRVLFIHGISTSCTTLGRLAGALVQRGCRVMLYDIFGRGFSDGVGDLPHDARLYTSQVLFALASSPLSWTGKGALRVVGYSMGAGIAVHVAASFPDMVSSLVLVAPAGLIRASNFGLSRHIYSSGLVPERLLALLTKKRLQRPISSGRLNSEKKNAKAEGGEGHHLLHHEHEHYTDVAVAEAADPLPGAPVSTLERKVVEYVRWMVDNHEGFIPAFMSCIRFGPLTDQHAAFAEISKRKRGTTAMIFGTDDEIIDLKQYTEDALPLVGGKEHVRWSVLKGSHDVVMTAVPEIIKELDGLKGFWKA